MSFSTVRSTVSFLRIVGSSPTEITFMHIMFGQLYATQFQELLVADWLIVHASILNWSTVLLQCGHINIEKKIINKRTYSS